MCVFVRCALLFVCGCLMCIASSVLCVYWLCSVVVAVCWPVVAVCLMCFVLRCRLLSLAVRVVCCGLWLFVVVCGCLWLFCVCYVLLVCFVEVCWFLVVVCW